MGGKLVGCFQRQNTHGLLDVIDKRAQKTRRHSREMAKKRKGYLALNASCK